MTRVERARQMASSVSFLALLAVVVVAPKSAPGQVLAQPAPAAPVVVQAAAPEQPGVAVPVVAPQPSGPLVATVLDEQIAAPVTEVRDGQVFLATEPPRAVPLDEVASIEFRRPIVLAAEWVGQDNYDLANGGGRGASGVQDIHMRLHGLPAGRKIAQIVIKGTPAHGEVWALDTSKVASWEIALERAAGAESADLFVEPIQHDGFNLDYALTVTFEGGQEVVTAFKALSHTTNALRVDAANPRPAFAAAAPLADDAVELFLTDGGRFFGRLLSIADDHAAIVPSFGEEVRIPLLKVRGLRFLAPSAGAAGEQFAARLQSPGEQDTALALSPEQAVTPLAGAVESLSEGRLQFAYEGRSRSINVARLVGLVLATHPGEAASSELEQVVELDSGERLVGAWTGYSADTIQLTASWGAVALPAAAVTRVTCRNGRVVFVSDLVPTTVEESAWFGRALPWRKDQGLLGGPLAVRGQTFSKGLALHSRCALTYALDGRFESLQAMLGFEESATGLGRAACRVLGDGRELFAEADFRGDAEPRALTIDVTGVETLTIEVDFGEGEDVGDRVVWGNARLFKVRAAAE